MKMIMNTQASMEKALKEQGCDATQTSSIVSIIAWLMAHGPAVIAAFLQFISLFHPPTPPTPPTATQP